MRKLKSYALNCAHGPSASAGAAIFLSASSLYSGLAIVVLAAHALFIAWVVFGAVVTRSRPVLRWLHIISLVWGVLVEVLYWPCPLTLLETWLEQKAGVEPYQGGFLLHYLDKLVYPDLPAVALAIAAVVVVLLNLAYYARLFWMEHRAGVSTVQHEC